MSEGVDEDLLAVAGTVLKLLAQRGWCLGTAESLTGGMVGETITAVPGASVSYMGGVIGYTDREKTALLGVCLLYTSDAADDLLCVDLGGRRIIKKKRNSVL